MNNELEKVKLSYYQVMAFSRELSKLKNDNQYFNDGISRNFEYYVLERSKELSSMYPEMVLDFKQAFKPFEISQSMFKYLSNLTGINPLDKKTIRKYIPSIKQRDKEIFSNIEETMNKLS